MGIFSIRVLEMIIVYLVILGENKCFNEIEILWN